MAGLPLGVLCIPGCRGPGRLCPASERRLCGPSLPCVHPLAARLRTRRRCGRLRAGCGRAAGPERRGSGQGEAAPPAPGLPPAISPPLKPSGM